MDLSFPKKLFNESLQFIENKFNKKIILVVFGAEMIIERKDHSFLIWFTTLCRSDVLRMLLFFETNLFSTESMEVIGRAPAFQPRIKLLSLYDEDDTYQFIEYMSQVEWKVKIYQTQKKEIQNQCGGMFLLVKEALWYLRDNPRASLQEIFHHTEMRFNLSMLWNSFSKREQEVFERIVLHQSLSDMKFQSSLEYLEQVRFIGKKKGETQILVPIFSSFIENVVKNKKVLSMLNGKIVLNGIPVDSHFSKKERRLLEYLLNNRGKLIYREKLAENIWSESNGDMYSDWAIDSHLHRLRKKFIRLGLPKELLETKKGIGVLLHK